MTSSDKLVIGQIDPTTRCGNICGHCGEASTLKGVDLPSDEMRAVLDNEKVEVEGEGGVFEQTRKLVLCGGGDPTFHPKFIEILIALSRYVDQLRFLTGGLDPRITIEDLERARDEAGDEKIRPTISIHPFWHEGYERRIKRTIEMLTKVFGKETTLKIISIPKEVLTGIEASERSKFPWLTPSEFGKSRLRKWIMERYRDVVLEEEAAEAGIPYRNSSGLTPVRFYFFNQIMTSTGRALDLPCQLRSDTVDEGMVSRFLQRMSLDAPSTALRLTAEGFLTGCDGPRFERPELFEADARGHTVEEALHNRRLFIDHAVGECGAWLASGAKEEGTICNTVCRRAREAFVRDPKRVRSHMGEGKTILRARRVA